MEPARSSAADSGPHVLARLTDAATTIPHFEDAVEACAAVLAEATGGFCVIALRADGSASSLLPVGASHPDPRLGPDVDELLGNSFSEEGFLGRAFVHGETTRR